jgi:hypothetical protein
MHLAGLPVWALILGACVVVPFLVQALADAEGRRVKVRTRALLHAFVAGGSGRLASGTARAASTGQADDEDGPG